MTRIALLLIMAVFCLLAGCQPKDVLVADPVHPQSKSSAEITFAVPDSGFSVELPREPKLQQQREPTFFGEVDVDLYLVIERDLGLNVTVARFPAGFAKGFSPDDTDFLATMRDRSQLAQLPNSKLISRRRVETDAGPCVEDRIEITHKDDGKTVILCRAFREYDTLICFAVVVPMEAVATLESQAAKYFASIRHESYEPPPAAASKVLANTDLEELFPILDRLDSDDLALEELKAYLASHDDDFMGWVIYAHRLFRLERHAEAEQAIKIALPIEENYAYAWCIKALIQAKKGEYSEALESYERALKIDPRNAVAYESMPGVAIKTGDAQLALRVAQRAYAAKPRNPIVAANLAVAYHITGDYQSRDNLAQLAHELGYKDMARMEAFFNRE